MAWTGMKVPDSTRRTRNRTQDPTSPHEERQHKVLCHGIIPKPELQGILEGNSLNHFGVTSAEVAISQPLETGWLKEILFFGLRKKIPV